MQVPAALALILLAGCGAQSGPVTGEPDSSPPMPSGVPAAAGDVRTRGVVTVMDNGRPEVCLGAVAESWPPQCGGPRRIGWDWRGRRLELGQSGASYEQHGAVRWGRYALTGRWDGTSLTVLTAVPEAQYDTAPPERPDTPPPPSRQYGEAELTRIAERLGARLPGAHGAYPDAGHVIVDVAYDDGSLQEWADVEYGRKVVVVVSALVDIS